MNDLISYFLTLAVVFVGTQLFCFLIDLIAWAVRKKHPAKIEKSEDVSYPEFITVHTWHDSHRSHGYKQTTFIRKGDNKYKKKSLSVGGWIWNIILYSFILAVIFGFPVSLFIIAPHDPHPEYLGYSFIVFFMFMHSFLIGPDTLARMELKKYLKAQSK